MKLNYFKESLKFIESAGTSRGVLLDKPSWIFYIDEDPLIRGECSIIPGLSPDYINDEQYEGKLRSVCEIFNTLILKEDQNVVLSFLCVELKEFPSILFGLETTIYNWNLKGNVDAFKSGFSKGDQGILINGLIWMGTVDNMLDQLEQKVGDGYQIIKLKIGAIEFNKEFNILKAIRNQYGQDIEIRVDANGAFEAHQIRAVLSKLKEQKVHSIEQPIQKGNWKLMKELCMEQMIPIALDEELIGVTGFEAKKKLLDLIRPQYIILKPSLHGGIHGCNEWINLAQKMQIGWWLTSALESNIGLEMIARFAASFDLKIAQGLGTGGLFQNNFESNLFIDKGYLFLRDEKE